jgi:anti-anti-sigma factor
MPAPEFNIDVRDADALLVLALTGELDLLTVPLVEAAIAVHGTSRTAIVLDLRGLTFMDSSAIRLLVTLQQDGNGSAMAFVAPSDDAGKVLDLCGVRPHMTWIADPADALSPER